MRPKTKVSVSVSIFETNFIKSQSQSQNLIPISKVSVSVSKIETGYTESQSQSQHAKTRLTSLQGDSVYYSTSADSWSFFLILGKNKF